VVRQPFQQEPEIAGGREDSGRGIAMLMAHRITLDPNKRTAIPSALPFPALNNEACRTQGHHGHSGKTVLK
ncbi:hypothetical protein, partial [Xylella fastidiosa]|uniref:hypothetical protein n=4 Tax=Xylella fastidiosa TaxID=2371 RepID=UPI002360105E